MQAQIKTSKVILNILNQVFEIENKLTKISEPHTIQRNIDKIKYYFETRLSRV